MARRSGTLYCQGCRKKFRSAAGLQWHRARAHQNQAARNGQSPVPLTEAQFKGVVEMSRRALRASNSRLDEEDLEELTQEILFRLYHAGVREVKGKLRYTFVTWEPYQLVATIKSYASRLVKAHRRQKGGGRGRREVLLSGKGRSPASDEQLFGVAEAAFGEFDPEEARGRMQGAMATDSFAALLQTEAPLTYKVWAATYGEPPYGVRHSKAQVGAMFGLSRSEVTRHLEISEALAHEFASTLANSRRVLSFRRSRSSSRSGRR